LIFADKAFSVGISTSCFVDVDLGEFAKLREAIVSFVMPVCVCPSVHLFAWNKSATSARIFVKLIFEDFSKITQDMFERIWREWEYRLDICRVTRGAHIECI